MAPNSRSPPSLPRWPTFCPSSPPRRAQLPWDITQPPRANGSTGTHATSGLQPKTARMEWDLQWQGPDMDPAGDLLAKSIVNAFVRIRPTDPALLSHIGSLHDVRRWVETDADGNQVVVIPLGDLFAGEKRELLVHFEVPGIAALGLHELATLAIEYIALPGLDAQTVSWPMTVNVVPGDRAAGRTPNPTVTTARLLAEATKVKKEASEALRRGDSASAERLMTAEAAKLRRAARAVPVSAPHAADLRSRLSEEQSQAEKLARSARDRDVHMSRKSFMEDIAMESAGKSDRMRRDRARRVV
jgi:hypothetical protein